MADTAKERLEKIKTELKTSEKRYQEWCDEFGCDRLEDFVVKSRQRKGPDGKGLDKIADHYLVNLLSPSLGARLPALMFTTPHAIVTPTEPQADDLQPGAPPVAQPGPPAIPPEMLAMMSGAGIASPPMMQSPAPAPTAEQKAKLREDLLNTTIQSKRSCFSEEIKLAEREAFFRFGMVEVFFTAEYEKVKKPDAAREEGDDKDAEPEDLADVDPEKTPDRIPRAGTERIVFKRIPAKQVRISANSKNALRKCDWIGYYEWTYLADIKKNPNYKGRTKIDEKLISSSPGQEGQLGDAPKPSKAEGYRTEEQAPAEGMVKLWRLWNTRTGKKSVFIEDAEDFLQEREYSVFPLAALKFEEILDQFYPVPVAFNWTGAQIAYNETRDSMRVHRRRALRKFLYAKGALKDEALAKLASGEDMAFAEVEQEYPNISGAVMPAQMAPMDPIHAQEVQVVFNELQQVTKVGGEQRQVASSGTATQANIISINKQVQDSADRDVVATWLSELLTIALKLMEENFSLGQVIKTTVDLGTPGAQAETQKQTATWREIEMSDLGELDYEVSVDVETLSPPNSTLKAQQATSMLATMSNPNVLALFSEETMEPFVRKYLQTQGYRAEEEVQAIISGARAIVTRMQAAAAPPMPPGAPTPAAVTAGPPGANPADLAALIGGGGGIPA